MTEDLSVASVSELAYALAHTCDAASAMALVDRWIPDAEPQRGPSADPTPPTRTRDGYIGPWRPVSQRGETWFVRDDAVDAARLWADVTRIPPKRHASRIVLFGESVARAWGLDPLMNCASVLTELLNASERGTFEIVDLARSGLMPDMLVDTMRSARPLAGDAYVVFAGNNWLIPDPTEIDFTALAREVRESASWTPVAARIHQVVRDQAGRIVSSLCAAAREHGVPLLFLVPPYNLHDWWHDKSWMNPLLSSAERTLRSELLGRAEACLSAGAVAEAESSLTRVVDLEEGLSPSGLWLLGRCASARGDDVAAIALFERARDAALVLPVPPSPACYSVTAQAIRETVAREGADVIDIAAVLRVATGGAALGHDLFIDSVHLSARGVHLAMPAVAARMLPLLGKSAQPQNDAADVIRVVPRALAQAELGGVLFGARFGQPTQVLQARCRAAVAADPEIARAMRLYIERAVRRAPDVVCHAFQELLALEDHFPLLRYFRNRWQEDTYLPKRLDFGLLYVLCDAIRQHLPDVDELFENALRCEYAVSAGPISLLDGPGFFAPQSRVGSRQPHQHYFTAYERDTRFRIVNDDPSAAVRLTITTRVPGAFANGAQIRLVVNGTTAHVWTATQAWSSASWTAPRGTFEKGVNEVIVQWPDVQESRAERVARTADLLARPPAEDMSLFGGFVTNYSAGPFPNVYPSYGSIHDFTVASASELSRTMSAQIAEPALTR